MKYSKATNYALHTMVFLTLAPKGKLIGVEQLAHMQNLSPTYLSKILTKLVKAGLIESNPGVNGGYSIAEQSHNISFLDVIHAIEGKTHLFNCSLEHEQLNKNGDCLIENAMMEAEKKMKDELSKKYIRDIAKQIKSKKKHSMKKSGHAPKEKIAKKMEFLDNPERREDIPPEQLLNMLPIKKGDTILDLGAGTGYITIPAANIVEGLVYALDINPNMLEIINSKAKKENISNIKTLEGSIDDIPLPDNSTNLALASLVLHEVKQLAHSLQQIKQVLKPGGYFVCIEFEKKDNPAHSHPRIASSIMEQEIKNAGFRVTQKVYPTDAIYIIIAKKQ